MPLDFRQQPVVKTLPATEPVAAQIKRHSRHEHQIKFVQRNFLAACRRLAHAEFSGDDFGRQMFSAAARRKIFFSASKKGRAQFVPSASDNSSTGQTSSSSGSGAKNKIVCALGICAFSRSHKFDGFHRPHRRRNFFQRGADLRAQVGFGIFDGESHFKLTVEFVVTVV